MNLYIKFEVSIFNGCGDIFDKKSGEKEKKTNIGKKNRRRPIFNPTVQFVVVNLYTRFDVSILKGCGDIFDKKSGEKEKKNKHREEKQEKAHFQSHNTICRCEPVYQI